MPYIPTKPAVSTHADHVQWELDRKMSGDDKKSKFHGDRTMQDGRLSKLFSWAGAISIVLIPIFSVWAISLLVSNDKQLAILLSRPVSVSKDQYDADMRDTKAEIATIKSDVKDIQLKQAAVLSERNK